MKGGSLGDARLGILILLLAFGLRMIAAVNNLETALAPDEREYMDRAALVATNVWQDRAVFRPPLYPYAIALVYHIVGTPRLIVNTFHALLDTTSAALIFLLARGLFRHREIALLAALLFALSPQSISLSGALLSEPLFICLLLGGFVLVTRAARMPRGAAAFVGGALFGLAALTREVAAYFALAVVPLWWLVFVAQPFRTRARFCILFLAGLALILTPWVARNYNVEGRFLLLSTSGEYVFARDNLRTAQILRQGSSPNKALEDARATLQAELASQPQATRARYLYGRGLDAIRENGLYWLGYKASVVGGFWSVFRFERVNLGVADLPPNIEPAVSFAVRSYFVALIVLATMGAIAAPNDAVKLLIGLFVVYSLCLFLLTHYQLRYRYPLHVLLTPYAAYGVWVVVNLARTRRFSTEWVTAPRLILALATLLCFVPLMD
jgi:4-amino-4-deoxy-L-arabinose transferase-like glycosyltransferase